MYITIYIHIFICICVCILILSKYHHYPGNQPVLVLRNETDETVEEIDLSDYSTEGLHALMLEKVYLYVFKQIFIISVYIYMNTYRYLYVHVYIYTK
jgi:hypothetical protein